MIFIEEFEYLIHQNKISHLKGNCSKIKLNIQLLYYYFDAFPENFRVETVEMIFVTFYP